METCIATPVATPGKTCRIFPEFLVLVVHFGFQGWGTYEVKTKEIDNA